VIDRATRQPPRGLQISLGMATPLGIAQHKFIPEEEERVHRGNFRFFSDNAGALEFPDLFPGNYRILVRTAAGRSTTALARVTNADVEGLEIAVEDAPPISVDLRTDGGEQFPESASPALWLYPEADDLWLYPEADDPAPFNDPPKPLRMFSPLFGRGRSVRSPISDPFTRARAIYGESYRVGVKDLPSGWYLKEARFNGADALNDAAVFTASGSLELVVSPAAGQIVGVVRDDRGQPAVGVEAVLVPERARDHAELYRTATTDRSGRFEITSVVPGDYRIYAWAAMEPYAYFAPEAQRRFARQATSVRVSERSRNNVEVTLIPEALSQ
jgi:hypothetical protein